MTNSTVFDAAPRTAGLLTAAWLAVAPVAAEAHAILLESSPAANETTAGRQIPFVLRYNSRIDKARSKLTLIVPDKSEQRLPIGQDGAADVLTTTVDLPAGAYDLRWQVLAIDGHITRGDVPFSVKGE